MKMICWACATLVRRVYRSYVSACLLATSCPIRGLVLSEPIWTTSKKWRNKLRHRIAGNRMNMPEPRRRSVRRNLMKDLIRYDRIESTKARVHAIQAEVEKLITVAVKGREDARKHLAA